MELTASVKRFLTQANSKWQEESQRAIEDPGSKNLDDGIYTSKLSEAVVEESKGSGRLQIKWVWVVLEGEQRGNLIYMYQGLDGDDSLFYLGRDLLKMGVDLDDVSFDVKKKSDDAFIVNVLKALSEEDIVGKIQLRTKEGSQWPSLRQVLDDYEGDLDVEDEEEEEEEKPKGKKSTAKETKPDPKKSSTKGKKAEPEEEDEEEEEEEKPKRGRGRPAGAKNKPKEPVKPEPGKKGKKAPEPEEEEEEEEEEEAADEEEEEEALEIGMKVQFQYKGKSLVGKIKDVMPDDAKLKISSDGMVYTVALDKVEKTIK